MADLKPFFVNFIETPLFLALILIVVMVAFLPIFTRFFEIFKFITPRSKFLREAAVATQLIPRFNPFISLLNPFRSLYNPFILLFSRWLTKSRTLYIVGGDGAYFTKQNGKLWMNWLNNLTQKNINIIYIFTNITEECKNYLKINANFNNFDVYVLKENKVEQFSKYITYHPTLLDSTNPEKRLIWIEENHPKDSHQAYEISFIAPDDENFNKIFDESKKEVETILNNCNILNFKDAK